MGEWIEIRELNKEKKNIFVSISASFFIKKGHLMCVSMHLRPETITK